MHVCDRRVDARVPMGAATVFKPAEPLAVENNTNFARVETQKKGVLRVLLMQGHNNNCVPHVFLMLTKTNEPRRSMKTYLCIYPPPCLRHVVACVFLEAPS